MSVRDKIRELEPRLGWEQRRGARWVFDPVVRQQWGFSRRQCVRYVTSRRTILFSPKYMHPWHNYSIAKVLVRLAIRPVFERGRDDPLAVVAWQYETRVRPEFFDGLVTRWGCVINGGCVDVGKDNVERIHRRVFGYGLTVDPRNPPPRYVRKSIDQAAKDGLVLDAPTEAQPGFVYQRLVECEVHRGLYEDIRLCFVGGCLPLCMVRLRPEASRFGHMPDISDRGRRDFPFALAYVIPVSYVLEAGEVEAVERFAREIGLDYGEIDVLRDRVDGRLYAVDVNNMVNGPTIVLSTRHIRQILDCYTEATEAFLPRFSPTRI